MPGTGTQTSEYKLTMIMLLVVGAITLAGLVMKYPIDQIAKVNTALVAILAPYVISRGIAKVGADKAGVAAAAAKPPANLTNAEGGRV